MPHLISLGVPQSCDSPGSQTLRNEDGHMSPARPIEVLIFLIGMEGIVAVIPSDIEPGDMSLRAAGVHSKACGGNMPGGRKLACRGKQR